MRVRKSMETNTQLAGCAPPAVTSTKVAKSNDN